MRRLNFLALMLAGSMVVNVPAYATNDVDVPPEQQNGYYVESDEVYESDEYIEEESSEADEVEDLDTIVDQSRSEDVKEFEDVNGSEDVSIEDVSEDEVVTDEVTEEDSKEVTEVAIEEVTEAAEEVTEEVVDEVETGEATEVITEEAEENTEEVTEEITEEVIEEVVDVPETEEVTTEAEFKEPETEEVTTEAESEQPETEPVTVAAPKRLMATRAVNASSNIEYTIDTALGTLKPYKQDGKLYFVLPNNYDLANTSIKYTGGSLTGITTGDFGGGTISGDYTKSTSFTAESGQYKYNIVLLKSDVPTLAITLANGVTLANVWADKDTKWGGSKVVLYNNGDVFTSDNNVEMKGRGNSSWAVFDKKGYQIKFEKKTSLLGMGKAKKWTLIANAGDGTMMRNKLAYEFASGADTFAFTPTAKYVDLWVNGEYLGLYTLTEKVEIGSTRLDLQSDDAVLVENDTAFYRDEDFWYKSDITGIYYTMKESGDDTDHGFQIFKQSMNQFESLLVNGGAWSELEKVADLRSFAEYYLVNELVLNRELLATSFFMYKDGAEDVIHAGPVWDFDTAFGAENGTTPTDAFLANYGGIGSSQTPLFKYLSGYTEFVDIVSQMYNDKYKASFPGLVNRINELYNEIKTSADMNYIENNTTLGTTNRKNVTVLETFEKNVTQLINWITERAAKYIPLNYSMTITPKDNTSITRGITIRDSKHEAKNVRIAVWSDLNGQDDLRWYNLTSSENGWVYTVNLNNHGSVEGTYSVHAYATVGGVDKMTGHATLIYKKPSTTPTNPTTPGVDAETQALLNQYAAVFDPVYYLNTYPDLKAVFGDNIVLATRHFISNGMKEARLSKSTFNVRIYRANYADLNDAFGNDWPAYYLHYIQHGQKEHRVADRSINNGSSGSSGGTTQVTSYVYNGLDYAPVFDPLYYLRKYSDLKRSFGSNYQAAFNHFLNYGMREGRRASDRFDPYHYKIRYNDLSRAFGNNWYNYFIHYLQYGIKEGRLGK